MSRTVMAHVEKIVNVYPIEGADRVEMCQLLDFHILVKKDEVKIGDLVIYIEADSILPDGLSKEDSAKYDEAKLTAEKATGEDLAKAEAEMLEILSRNTIPEFEFLRQKKFRIKALKYNKFKDPFGNKIVSMGIVFPLSILETIPKALGKELPKDITEGLDVTELLNIEKVVEDAEDIAKDVSENAVDKFLMQYKFYRSLKKKMFPKISGTWQPDFPSPSDEENIQKIYSKFLEKYGTEDDGFYVSEKCEGNSAAYVFKNKRNFGIIPSYHFGACSRTRFLKTYDGSDWWRTARTLDLEKRMKAIGKNLFIRGEQVGYRIQGNIYKFSGPHVFLFEVFDLDKKRFYNYEQFMEFCLKYEFETVPILDDKFKLLPTVQEMLTYSNAQSKLAPVLREGVVIRRKDNVKESFKIRSPEYLIKHGK